MIPATIRRFGDVLDNATVAVVDPKLQSSAAKAHEWLPIKPGEDGALRADEGPARLGLPLPAPPASSPICHCHCHLRGKPKQAEAFREGSFLC